jgi:enoyl-[acyl-carrier protein] reductase I
VHAIGFSDKNELKGLYADTTRANFIRTMVISCFSFTEIAKRAAELMTNGGSMLTLTYNGSQRIMPNYNVMGVAKAALEASVRYLAADLRPAQHPRQRHLGRPDPHAGGRRHFRCACRSTPGTSKNCAATPQRADIDDSRRIRRFTCCQDMSSRRHRRIHYVDSGYNITSTPTLEVLSKADAE